MGCSSIMTPAVRQTSNLFLSSTPLGLLLQDNLKLAGSVTVTGIARATGQIQITIVLDEEPVRRRNHADLRDRSADAAQLDHPGRARPPDADQPL